jgi:hypothetical protein
VDEEKGKGKSTGKEKITERDESLDITWPLPASLRRRWWLLANHHIAGVPYSSGLSCVRARHG